MHCSHSNLNGANAHGISGNSNEKETQKILAKARQCQSPAIFEQGTLIKSETDLLHRAYNTPISTKRRTQEKHITIQLYSISFPANGNKQKQLDSCKELLQ